MRWRVLRAVHVVVADCNRQEDAHFVVCANKVHKKQCDLLLPLASVQLPRLQNHATERHSQKYPSSVQEPFDRVFFCCTWTAVPGAIHGALFVKLEFALVEQVQRPPCGSASGGHSAKQARWWVLHIQRCVKLAISPRVLVRAAVPHS